MITTRYHLWASSETRIPSRAVALSYPPYPSHNCPFPPRVDSPPSHSSPDAFQNTVSPRFSNSPIFSLSTWGHDARVHSADTPACLWRPILMTFLQPRWDRSFIKRIRHGSCPACPQSGVKFVVWRISGSRTWVLRV